MDGTIHGREDGRLLAGWGMRRSVKTIRAYWYMPLGWLQAFVFAGEALMARGGWLLALDEVLVGYECDKVAIYVGE